MTTRLAIGSITPSSNRIVERSLARILRCVPDVDSCIARIPYFGEGVGQPKRGYDHESYRQAAWMLGHAGVGVVCWNGTRGAGFGLDADRDLAATMASAAGCPATTTALATVQLLDALGARRIGIVTPGDTAYAEQAAAGLGRELVAVRSLGLLNNDESAAVPVGRIAALAREVAAEARPEAILLWSTNLYGLEAMAPLEAELAMPVIDSAAAGVWAALRMAGAPMAGAAPLGRMFTTAA
jgi:maleate isomerase